VGSAHQTVLLAEAVNALVTADDGFYVDGTFGRGGHSQLLLDRLGARGRVLGIDKDPVAVEVAREFAMSEGRFEFFHGSFALLPHQLRGMGIDAVDGILLDLGVSSPQLDEAERGFSFSHDGPLDMRMDTSRGETAAQWLAHAEQDDIAQVLKTYGEERFARRIAAAIVAARAESPIETTGRLAQIVSEANPKWEKHKHPATRSFQAIRIKINKELEDLEELLGLALDVLRIGGRLVVISFHSLEDRRVKDAFRDTSIWKRMNKKPIIPSDVEIARNPRSRSAKLRVAERVSADT